MTMRVRAHWPVILSLCALIGVRAVKSAFHASSAEADAYHQAIRVAADTVPYSLGSWLGTDVPVARDSVTLLQPNVMLSRRYTSLETNRSLNFLLVQCRDARDLLGHYPPVCYASRGFQNQTASPTLWTVDDLQITGTEYEFVLGRFGHTEHIVIDNFMILPQQGFCSDMDGLLASARHYRRRFLGAAQVQMVSERGISAVERQDLLESLIRAHRKLIDTILAGQAPEKSLSANDHQ